MKKLVMITMAALLLAKLSNAQTGQGDQTAGLTLGINYFTTHQNTLDFYSSTKTVNYIRQGSFSIAPSYSLFIARNVDLGISAAYSNYNLTDNYAPQYTSDLSQHQRYYTAELFLRKYFLYESKIGFRVGPYISYGHEFMNTIYPDANSPSNSASITESYSGGVQLDFVYYPTKHLSFTASLGNLSYQHDNISGEPTGGTENNFNLAFVNQNLSVGVFYTFN